MSAFFHWNFSSQAQVRLWFDLHDIAIPSLAITELQVFQHWVVLWDNLPIDSLTQQHAQQWLLIPHMIENDVAWHWDVLFMVNTCALSPSLVHHCCLQMLHNGLALLPKACKCHVGPSPWATPQLKLRLWEHRTFPCARFWQNSMQSPVVVSTPQDIHCVKLCNRALTKQCLDLQMPHSCPNCLQSLHWQTLLTQVFHPEKKLCLCFVPLLSIAPTTSLHLHVQLWDPPHNGCIGEWHKQHCCKNLCQGNSACQWPINGGRKTPSWLFESKCRLRLRNDAMGASLVSTSSGSSSAALMISLIKCSCKNVIDWSWRWSTLTPRKSCTLPSTVTSSFAVHMSAMTWSISGWSGPAKMESSVCSKHTTEPFETHNHQLWTEWIQLCWWVCPLNIHSMLFQPVFGHKCCNVASAHNPFCHT